MNDETKERIKALAADMYRQLDLASEKSRPYAMAAAAIEKQIRDLAIVGVELKAEGQKSVPVADGMKIVFSRSATRTADTGALQENWAKLPREVQDVFAFEAAIDLKALRKLDEEQAVVAARYYSTKVGDVKMKIEVAK